MTGLTREEKLEAIELLEMRKLSRPERLRRAIDKQREDWDRTHPGEDYAQVMMHERARLGIRLEDVLDAARKRARLEDGPVSQAQTICQTEKAADAPQTIQPQRIPVEVVPPDTTSPANQPQLVVEQETVVTYRERLTIEANPFIERLVRSANARYVAKEKGWDGLTNTGVSWMGG